MSLEIPKDFEGKIIDKENLNKFEGVILIYFDENKWAVDSIMQWNKCISNYLNRPILFLPKSFSELRKLKKDQLELLIKLLQNCLDELDK